MTSANWNYPTSVKFGAGRLGDLPALCRQLGMTRPLLVTDPVVARLPMVEHARALNEAEGLPTAIFAEVQPNPAGADVEAGLAAYRAHGADGVIVFGGGSAMDAGKTIAFMSGQTRPLWDFEDVGDWWTRADPAGIAPIVAIPTTAGTGSEVGRGAVIIDEAVETKKIIFHPKMLPGMVILDPELTVGLPPHITGATGMDALSHCLEAYCAPGFHPMADGIAVEGTRLVAEFLPRAYRDGSDLEARGAMLAAASMGATAFQKGLGGMHALAHPIGAIHHAHHGLTNAVLMPYVLQFNRPAVEEKLGRLAAYIGLKAQTYAGFLDWVLELREAFAVPHTLAGLNVGDERAHDIALAAETDPSASTNPILFDRAAARQVFDAALGGRL